MSVRLVFALLATCLLPLAGSAASPAAAPPPMNAAEIQLALNKLLVAGRVLYVAAHPDDENTTLIAYWANGALYDTAYLSLTRGDGGQNLIGSELREPLGVIRTQELLAARRIDHGQQLFTRANDFGFSKTSEESLRIWDRDKVLADVVWAIRRFQPDVIVTRFSAGDKNTHGHHSASAELANEAFRISGDPTRYPEQLAFVHPWAAQRIFWNSWPGYRAEENNAAAKPQIGEVQDSGYEPLLGLLFPEIAALSRSMHKSQGFGVGANRNARPETFVLTGGTWPAGSDQLFVGIETRWENVVTTSDGPDPLGLMKMALPALKKAVAEYRPEDPAASVPALLEARHGLAEAIARLSPPLVDTRAGTWLAPKLAEVDRLIAACLGLHLASFIDKAAVHPGEPVAVQFEAMYRAAPIHPQPFDAPVVPVKLSRVKFPVTGQSEAVETPLVGGQMIVRKSAAVLPAYTPYSQPYWLREPSTVGTYTVSDQQLIGLPQNPPAFPVEVSLDIGGQEITYALDTRYHRVDPVAGEVTEPMVVAPAVFVELPRPVFVFGDAQAKIIDVRAEASSDSVETQLALEVPAGWQVTPASAPLALHGTGTAATLRFTVTPPADPKVNQGELAAVLIAADGKRTPAYGRQPIRYPHIDPQTLIPRATAKLVRADIRNTGKRIGYVAGAGDVIPESLREIGADVKTLTYDDLHASTLAHFDAVIFGVRAYNVQPARFTASVPEMTAYAQAGGVVIYQYNTLPGPGEDGTLPFPLRLSHDRVTDETAEVRLLVPEHPLLTTPNKITAADFDGWVQERGLYFADQWDAAWTPILSCNDPGEKPMDGGLLAARCGKGYVIYTSYSWFRELPAGVPGAYRLFANMISLGQPPK